MLGATQRPPCPHACPPASRAAQVHVRALFATQCFQHCQLLLAHRLSPFEKVLGEPRFTTWATLAAHLCLVVAGVRAARISVARQPPAKISTATSCDTGTLRTAHPDAICSSQLQYPRGKAVESPPPLHLLAFGWLLHAHAAPTSPWASSPSALSTALNSRLISPPTSRTCCKSPGLTPGLLWEANQTCLCAGSLLQVADAKCGGMGGKWW